MLSPITRVGMPYGYDGGPATPYGTCGTTFRGRLPVKIAVMAVVVAALAFPGQADEIVVIALIRAVAYLVKRRKEKHA